MVLAAHAAQCLGIAASQLNLPRVGDGVDADALWRSPRYAEVIRQQEALRRKAEERRFEHSRAGAHPELESAYTARPYPRPQARAPEGPPQRLVRYTRRVDTSLA